MKTIIQRYILFQLISDTPEQFEEKAILNVIWKQLGQLFGVKFSFLAGLWLIRWDPKNCIGILRCDNITKYQVITAMAFIKKMNQPVIFHTIYTSGTIKKALQIWKERLEFNG